MTKKKIHPEIQTGWFFAILSFLFAIWCLAMALVVNGGMESAGWMIGAFGWGLNGSGCIALGRERAKRT